MTASRDSVAAIFRSIATALHRWSRAQQPRSLRPITPSLAYAFVVALWCLGYGAGTVRAVKIARGRPAAGPAQSWSDVMGSIIQAGPVQLLAAVVGIAALCWCHRGRPRELTVPRGTAGWAADTMIYFGFVTAAMLGSVAGRLIAAPAVSSTEEFPTAYTIVEGSITGLIAGVGEEIALVAVPVVVLRAAKQPWWIIIALASILRVSFHVYYGPFAIGLVVWAISAILLFAATRRLWPMVAAHAMQNIALSLPEGALPIYGLILWALATAAMAYLIINMWRPQLPRKLTSA